MLSVTYNEQSSFIMIKILVTLPPKYCKDYTEILEEISDVFHKFLILKLGKHILNLDEQIFKLGITDTICIWKEINFKPFCQMHKSHLDFEY